MKKCLFVLLSALLLAPAICSAQSNINRNYVTIRLTPDHDNWVYKTGENPTLAVSVERHNVALKNITVKYAWGEEKLTPIDNGTLNTGNRDGVAKLTLKGMKRPGFMTLVANVNIDGHNYTNYINLGFEPDKIATTTKLPDDFRQFWDGVLAENSKIPLQPMMTLQPDLCTPEVNVYHIRFQNMKVGSYIYGMLAMPKQEGVYPAVLRVPGAGVRAYYGETSLAARGFVVLQVGIHGIEVNMAPKVYSDLKASALSNYNTYNNDNRDKYYYKKVYAGCVKAVDFLTTLPEVDKERIVVAGGSQGGALSIVVASLNKRIKGLFACYPALSQIGGYYRGTTGGWPHLFRDRNESDLDNKVKVSEYYDVVNFARFITVPGGYCWGFNDTVCPPTSTFAAYNQITAPKELFLFLDTSHWRYPEEIETETRWIEALLK